MKTIRKGTLSLYMMLHAYSMLDMKVAGDTVRGVSTMYRTTVGKLLAKDSVIMAPEALHVKISICPGVSKKMVLCAPRQTPPNQAL